MEGNKPFIMLILAWIFLLFFSACYMAYTDKQEKQHHCEFSSNQRIMVKENQQNKYGIVDRRIVVDHGKEKYCKYRLEFLTDNYKKQHKTYPQHKIFPRKSQPAKAKTPISKINIDIEKKEIQFNKAKTDSQQDQSSFNPINFIIGVFVGVISILLLGGLVMIAYMKNLLGINTINMKLEALANYLGISFKHVPEHYKCDKNED